MLELELSESLPLPFFIQRHIIGPPSGSVHIDALPRIAEYFHFAWFLSHRHFYHRFIQYLLLMQVSVNKLTFTCLLTLYKWNQSVRVSACPCALVLLFYGHSCDGTAADIQSTSDGHCGSFWFLSWPIGNAYVRHCEMMSLILPGFSTFANMICYEKQHTGPHLCEPHQFSPAETASSQPQLRAGGQPRVYRVVSFSDLQGTD